MDDEGCLCQIYLYGGCVGLWSGQTERYRVEQPPSEVRAETTTGGGRIKWKAKRPVDIYLSVKLLVEGFENRHSIYLREIRDHGDHQQSF